MPHSNLPTCALLLFWHRPAWRQLAEEKQAYRWPPGLPSSPPLSSEHSPPDRSAPEVVCRTKANTDGKLVSAYQYPVADLGGVKGMKMHPPLAASNVFFARVHQMIMHQWHAATTTRHNYTLTYQFLTYLQTFG